MKSYYYYYFYTLLILFNFVYNSFLYSLFIGYFDFSDYLFIVEVCIELVESYSEVEDLDSYLDSSILSNTGLFSSKIPSIFGLNVLHLFSCLLTLPS